jgi:hypothetical protein
MSNIITSMWRLAKLRRVVAIGVAIGAGAFVLLMVLCSLGDSDLPPYDPPFPGERLGWMIFGVISWPLVLAAWIRGEDPPGFLWLPLLFFAGLFWASLIEVGINLVRRARKS